MKDIHLQKQSVVESIVADMQAASSAVVLDYRGITVAEFTALRNDCRKAGVTVRVLKNTLVVRACKDFGLEGLDEALNGPTAIFFAKEDPSAAAKILREFAAKSKKTTVKAGFVGTAVLDAKGVAALADLPSRDVLVAKMLGTLNRPASGFVGVLSGVPRALVCALEAIRKQKEAA